MMETNGFGTIMEALFGVGVRLLVTCPDELTREEAIHRFTGGTSLLTGQYELGLDQRLTPAQTPDNRYGAILHIWVPWAEANTPFKGKPISTPSEYIENVLEFNDIKALGLEPQWTEKKAILYSALKKRLRDALLPIPSVSIYSAAKRKSEDTKLDLGLFSKSLSLGPIFEGEQEQKRLNMKDSKLAKSEQPAHPEQPPHPKQPAHPNQPAHPEQPPHPEQLATEVSHTKKSFGKCYNVILLGGMIKIEDQFAELGICGAAFFISGYTLESGLQAGREALRIIESIPEVCHIFDVCGSGIRPNKKASKKQNDDKKRSSHSESPRSTDVITDLLGAFLGAGNRTTQSKVNNLSPNVFDPMSSMLTGFSDLGDSFKNENPDDENLDQDNKETQIIDLINQYPELAGNPAELVLKHFSMRGMDALSLSMGGPSLEIIMNAFSYQKLAECIKKIQDEISRHHTEIYLRPAWYDWEWGNIALDIERLNSTKESHSKPI